MLQYWSRAMQSKALCDRSYLVHLSRRERIAEGEHFAGATIAFVDDRSGLLRSCNENLLQTTDVLTEPTGLTKLLFAPSVAPHGEWSRSEHFTAAATAAAAAVGETPRGRGRAASSSDDDRQRRDVMRWTTVRCQLFRCCPFGDATVEHDAGECHSLAYTCDVPWHVYGVYFVYLHIQ